MTPLRPLIAALTLCLSLVLTPAWSAARDSLEAFVDVIGYDVMLGSMAQSAQTAPRLLGFPDGAFGDAWVDIANEVFEKNAMVEEALDILEATLPDDLLGAAAEFYSSPLGLRLVEAENRSHLEDDAFRRSEGQAIVADLVAKGSDRPQIFTDMMNAIGAEDSSVRAAIELQVRFYIAASSAGVIDVDLNEAELRSRLNEGQAALRTQIQIASLAGSAYTYRSFSDEEVAAYRDALRTEEMRLVYELLGAIQFELQAARYEELARRMAKLFPGQEL